MYNIVNRERQGGRCRHPTSTLLVAGMLLLSWKINSACCCLASPRNYSVLVPVASNYAAAASVSEPNVPTVAGVKNDLETWVLHEFGARQGGWILFIALAAWVFWSKRNDIKELGSSIVWLIR